MVAVGPSRFSESLIRWTRRIAYNLEAPWLAVYVETSRPLRAADQETLQRNLALAAELGAEVITAAGDDIPGELLLIARQRNISQIVMGKPLHTRLQDLLRGGSPVDHVIRSSGQIDVMVVTGEEVADGSGLSALSMLSVERHSTFWQYVASGLIVFGVTLISLTFAPLITTELIGLLELFAVLLIAYFFGRGPALLAAAISALSWNYLFIEPRFTLQIGRPQDIVLLALYFAIALFTGNLTARIRRHERQSRRNAERTMALYALAHEVASAVDMDAVLLTAVREIGRAFNAEVGVVIAGEHGLQLQTCSTLPMDEKELSVAKWAYESGKPAGRFTDTLPSAAATHLPLNTGQATVGVLAIRTAGDQRLSFDQMGLLDTFTNQLAVVVEREILDQQMERAEMARESERLYTALLNSISHELRTPIATVVGASTSLRDLPDGRVEMTLHVADTLEVRRWILGYGVQAEVVEPTL